MTVNTTRITSGPYAGNGVADTFSYTFRVIDKTQLTVYETDLEGNQIRLAVDTDYIVNSVGDDDGGTITRVDGALPTGYQWYIRSNYLQTQLTAFQSQGAFFPDLHEGAMDLLTFLVQQLADSVDRSPSLPDSYTGSLPISLPLPEAGKYLKWKDSENGFENSDVDGSIALEAAAREAADNLLQSNINEEAAARQAGDANLQAQITGSQELEASQFSPLAWHKQIIENSVTIPDDRNAWSIGPSIEIADGQSIVIGENSNWTIV